MCVKRSRSGWSALCFFGLGCLALAFIPVFGLAQEDAFRVLTDFDDLANPVITTKTEWEKAVQRYDSLAIRIAKGEKQSLWEDEKDARLAQSLVVRFLDFSRQLQDHEPRELVFEEAGIMLNLPAGLNADVKKRISRIARKSYLKVAQRWRDMTALAVPPGHIFLKVFATQEEMRNRYGLEEETMGVAFPCRYIAAALRLDPAGNLVQQEFESVLAHEIVHVFGYIVLGFSRINRLPLWFHEGVAMELSGQTRIQHVVQDASGTFILTLTSPEDYLKYHRVFRFLGEKFGRQMLGAFISRALITAELSGTEAESLLLQSEKWFRDKRKLEWLIIILTGMAAFLVHLLVPSRKGLLFFGVALTGLLVLSLTPYYVHSRLKYGAGVLLLTTLAYLVYRALSASFLAAQLLREADRFEKTGDDVRAMIALKSFLRIERDDVFRRWLDKGKVERIKERQAEVERRFVRNCRVEAARFEEQLDFQRAIERYQMIVDTATGLPEEREEARQNLERIKAVGQLFSLLSRDSEKRPSS